MYREAVRKELSQGTLTEISLEDFQISHPFNFVYLKIPDQAHIEYWFDQIIKLRESINLHPSPASICSWSPA